MVCDPLECLISTVQSGVGFGASIEDALIARDALQRIPPGQRSAVLLRYYQDLSVAETARVPGISQGSVKSQTARGLTALRAALLADHSADAGWPVRDTTIEVGERERLLGRPTSFNPATTIPLRRASGPAPARR